MRHPTEGVLRRLLDEPAGVSVDDREHVAACTDCLAALAAMRADADLVGAALAYDGGADVDVDAAWLRLTTAPAAAPATTPPARPGRRRSLLRHPATAALAVAVVLAGGGTAAANHWLRIFRTERIAPVSLRPADLMSLPDLSAYGHLLFSGEPNLRRVPDAATAAAQTGLPVPQVTEFPRGVTGEPEYQVGQKVTATFTFSAERARRAAKAAGHELPPLPPGLDGTQVRLVAGPGVAAVWTHPTGVPALIVGRAFAPTAFSSGAPFETVRDYLLSLPGLPDHVAAQLRRFTADGATLPLPVPQEHVTTTQTTINGAPATVLETRAHTLAVVVWVRDGIVTAVAGPLDAGQVRDVASGLR